MKSAVSTIMQTATVSEQEYLTTSYQPDCEFEDGVLVERNVGEEPHSRLQFLIILYFGKRRREWGISIYPEQRFQIAPKHYLIPDIAVISGPRATENIITQPPLIWIEILSPEDRPLRVNQKIREVLAFGVPNIWIIDPKTLEAEVYTVASSYTAHDRVLRVSESPIALPLLELEEE
jgi:Uma2 family endonuclease